MIGWECPKCHRVWSPMFSGPCICFNESNWNKVTCNEFPIVPQTGPIATSTTSEPMDF